MDKYEYNLRNEEINALIGQREFQRAVQIADTIDWTKVRSVKTLCKISDLYKINRRYNEAKILLEQALDRYPNGKSIVSSLCELCVRMGDVVGATEYYKIFVDKAPTDNIKFILLYKIYEAQEVSLDERIEVLEELKKRERIEKWCYELAYLYHRIGLTTKCVEECDDLILWFREGRYVRKAMELKMLHQQLTSSQEALYQNMLNPRERMEHIDQTEVHDAKEERIPESELVKTVDVGTYSTINIQKALEESIRGTMGENPKFKSGDLVENEAEHTVFIAPEDEVQAQAEEPIAEEEAVFDEEDTIVSGNTDNIAKSILAPMMQDTGEMQELFFQAENTGEIEIDEEPDMPVSSDTIVYEKGMQGMQPIPEAWEAEETAPVVNPNTATKEELMELIDKKVAEALENAIKGRVVKVYSEAGKSDMSAVAPPRSMQKILSQEYDGQISLVIPEDEAVEKQITGQINIEEYLADWENTKRQSQQKNEEEIKELINRETGSLFTEFEEKARDGILEKLEAEAGKKTVIDADKEYEEYLKRINEEAGIEQEEAPETIEDEALAEAETAPLEEESAEEPLEEEEPVAIAEPEAEEAEEVEAKGPVEEPKEEENEEEFPEVEELTEIEDDTDNIPEKEEPKTEAKEDAHVRALTEEELSLFSQYIQTKKSKQNLAKALDSISLASYTGNVFVTGDATEEAVGLAKNVIQYAKNSDGNFSGKIGKVSGASLNGKDITSTVERMKNGGLIIERAGEMSADTVKDLMRTLNQENLGILVVLQDSKKEMKKMSSRFDGFKQIFNVHVEIEELSDDALVAYGRQYAERMEFAIDEMGILALHTRIDEMQTSDHIVTVSDVREIVDEAIKHATRFSPKHLADVLFGRRYDEEDMIILKERDFIN